ncbi:MAG: hypothetical protein AAB638_03175, partial [Patescibacteria group bacterium]
MRNLFIPRNYYRAHEHVFHVTATLVLTLIFAWLGWVILIPTSALNDSQRVHVASGKSLWAISKIL